MTGGSDLRVLLVSTAPAVTREVRDALSTDEAGRFTIDVVGSARQAIVALRRLPSEVTLVDIGKGESPGLQELQLVSSTTVDTALIAISSVSGEAVAMAAIGRGAQDCLVRGSDDLGPAMLRRAISSDAILTMIGIW